MTSITSPNKTSHQTSGLTGRTAFHISTIGPLLASLGYTAVFAFLGIRFLHWDAR